MCWVDFRPPGPGAGLDRGRGAAWGEERTPGGVEGGTDVVAWGGVGKTCDRDGGGRFPGQGRSIPALLRPRTHERLRALVDPVTSSSRPGGRLPVPRHGTRESGLQPSRSRLRRAGPRRAHRRGPLLRQRPARGLRHVPPLRGWDLWEPGTWGSAASPQAIGCRAPRCCLLPPNGRGFSRPESQSDTWYAGPRFQQETPATSRIRGLASGIWSPGSRLLSP